MTLAPNFFVTARASGDRRCTRFECAERPTELSQTNQRTPVAMAPVQAAPRGRLEHAGPIDDLGL